MVREVIEDIKGEWQSMLGGCSSFSAQTLGAA